MLRRDFLTSVGMACLATGIEPAANASETAAASPSEKLWPSRPPENCPFVQSEFIKGIEFTGHYAAYENADTWFPSWASDGNLYSPFTDGVVGRVRSSSVGPSATTGHAKILGDDPMHLSVTALGVHSASPWPYGGRYPSANLVHNGVWYYGTYCLDQKNPHLNWDVLGPFVGFRISRDFGASWVDPPSVPTNPLFLENGQERRQG
jgi:hypothetical protein